MLSLNVSCLLLYDGFRTVLSSLNPQLVEMVTKALRFSHVLSKRVDLVLVYGIGAQRGNPEC